MTRLHLATQCYIIISRKFNIYKRNSNNTEHWQLNSERRSWPIMLICICMHNFQINERMNKIYIKRLKAYKWWSIYRTYPRTKTTTKPMLWVWNMGRHGSTLGQGALDPQTSAFPKSDMKHSLANSKHQYIGAKGTFCGLQNAPKCVSDQGCAPDPADKTNDAPQTR